MKWVHVQINPRSKIPLILPFFQPQSVLGELGSAVETYKLKT